MQRWIKLPDGRHIDARRVAYVGKPEPCARIDENGQDLGGGFMVVLGTDLTRDTQISVSGSRDEILALLKSLLAPAHGPAGAVSGPMRR